jgi:ABC-type lipoprotein export system ATPase subunit
MPELTSLLPSTVADPSPIVQVEHLSRVYQSRAQKVLVLDDLSFAIPAVSLFAITGPSGSGKSTLLNMLSGIDRPTSGRVLFGGVELRARSENQLARWRGRQVGVVFQFFQLIPTLTAAENVLLALELGGGRFPTGRARRERVDTCLEMVHADEFARRLPSQLSGGQQQRVAIARALANDPPVLIADEPTGNLDSRSAEAVFATLADLRHYGKTIVYVTHSAELAAPADAGIALLDGRIAASLRTGRTTNSSSSDSTSSLADSSLATSAEGATE